MMWVNDPSSELWDNGNKFVLSCEEDGGGFSLAELIVLLIQVKMLEVKYQAVDPKNGTYTLV